MTKKNNKKTSVNFQVCELQHGTFCDRILFLGIPLTKGNLGIMGGAEAVIQFRAINCLQKKKERERASEGEGVC